MTTSRRELGSATGALGVVAALIGLVTAILGLVPSLRPWQADVGSTSASPLSDNLPTTRPVIARRLPRST